MYFGRPADEGAHTPPQQNKEKERPEDDKPLDEPIEKDQPIEALKETVTPSPEGKTKEPTHQSPEDEGPVEKQIHQGLAEIVQKGNPRAQPPRNRLYQKRGRIQELLNQTTSLPRRRAK